MHLVEGGLEQEAHEPEQLNGPRHGLGATKDARNERTVSADDFAAATGSAVVALQVCATSSHSLGLYEHRDHRGSGTVRASHRRAGSRVRCARTGLVASDGRGALLAYRDVRLVAAGNAELSPCGRSIGTKRLRRRHGASRCGLRPTCGSVSRRERRVDGAELAEGDRERLVCAGQVGQAPDSR